MEQQPATPVVLFSNRPVRNFRASYFDLSRRRHAQAVPRKLKYLFLVSGRPDNNLS